MDDILSVILTAFGVLILILIGAVVAIGAIAAAIMLAPVIFLFLIFL